MAIVNEVSQFGGSLSSAMHQPSSIGRFVSKHVPVGSSYAYDSFSAVTNASIDVVYGSPVAALSLENQSADHPEDLEYAARFANRDARERFIGGRALLRCALSATVNGKVTPSEWQFVYGPNGKPAVAPSMPQVQFSVTHVDRLIAVATSLTCQLGIDLEPVSNVSETSPIDDFLTLRERAWLSSFEKDETWPAFAKLWTAKEAAAKALGLGVALDFREIEIDVEAGRIRCTADLISPIQTLDLAIETLSEAGSTYSLSIANLGQKGCKTSIRMGHCSTTFC